MIWSLVVNAATKFIDNWQTQKQRDADAKAAWEAAAGRSMENGWKDEYVTVIITLPILQSFVGNLWFAITGHSNILDAQVMFLDSLGQMMETDYGDLMVIVVLAAVGIKGIKSLR